MMPHESVRVFYNCGFIIINYILAEFIFEEKRLNDIRK